MAGLRRRQTESSSLMLHYVNTGPKGFFRVTAKYPLLEYDGVYRSNVIFMTYNRLSMLFGLGARNSAIGSFVFSYE